MLLTNLILALSCFYLSQTKETYDVISVISDFLSVQKFPTKVNAYICWNSEMTSNFAKKISNHYATRISSPNSSLIRTKPEEFQLFLLDLSCNHSENIMNQAKEFKMLKAPFRWILINHESSEINLRNYFFDPESKIFLIDESLTSNQYEIKSIYKYSFESTQVIENHIATWTKAHGFNGLNELSSSRNRSNFKGHPVTISYVFIIENSLEHIWDYRKKDQDGITKVSYILSHFLIDMINATLIKIHRRSWGYQNATTKKFTGMMGDVQSGLADIGGTQAFMLEERLSFTDFIAIPVKTSLKFIFKAPPLSYVTNVYTLPFHTYVWYASFAIILIILIVMFVIIKWEVTLDKTITKPYKQCLDANVLDVVMMEVGAITQQGYEEEASSLSGRIATFCTFIALMFLYTAYAANIVALLQSTTDSISTVNDLLTSRIKLGVEDIDYAQKIYDDENEPIRKRIYQEKIKPNGQKANFYSLEDGIAKMRTEFFAFHVEPAKAYQLIRKTFHEHEKCNLKIVNFISFGYPLITLQKNSSFKEILKIRYRRLHETGVQEGQYLRFYLKKPTCASKGSNFVSVGLGDCYAAFLIFGTGMSLSLSLLILEGLVHRYKMKKLVAVVERYSIK